MSLLQCKSRRQKSVRVTLSRPLLEGVNFPVVITSAILPGDKEESLFVATQTGQIYRLQNGEKEVWLDLSDRILPLGSGPCPLAGPFDERGLLGLAFHRCFEKNGLFYVFYSERGEGPRCPPFVEPNPCDPATLQQRWVDRTRFYDHVNTLEEWKVNACGRFKQRRTLLSLRLPSPADNGVDNVHYSEDRLLLLTGDGQSAFDVFGLAQDDNELLGKIISLNVDCDRKARFTGPAISRLDEVPDALVSLVTIVGKGLRIPVGEVEEEHCNGRIRYVAQGGEFVSESIFAFEGFCQPTSRKTGEIVNFGWRGWEGNIPTLTAASCPSGEGEQSVLLYYDDMVRASALRINPIIDYYHTEAREGKPNSSSITSLAIYRGDAIPGLGDNLIFSDFGTVRGLNPDGQPIITGFLGHSNVCRSRLDKTQDFSVIEVDFLFPSETFLFTTLGSDLQRKRLFLGVGFTLDNVQQRNQANVYEILPTDKHQ